MFRVHLHHIHLFQHLIPFFSTWGYFIIFFFSFLEGIPLLGYIAPGGVSVILGGFLARAGVLSLWQVMIYSTVAAFLGDLIAFGIGTLYGHHFLKKYGRYFFLKERHIEKTEKLLQSHTGKAIIIGRFSYFSRSLSPFLAGASGIKVAKFISFDVLAVFIWSITHFSIGFIAGQGYLAAAKYFNFIILAAIIICLIIFYTYRFINARHHIFKKYHIYTLILNIFSFYVFAQVLEGVLDHGWIFHLDHLVNNQVPLLWNPVAIQFMIAVSNLLTPFNVFVLACLLIGYLLYHRRFYDGLLAFFALVSGVLSEYGLKILFGVARPLEPILSVSNFSFPSGHATVITIFSFLTFYTLRRDLKNKRQKIWLLIVCIALSLLVGASRIYLNVHWLSDVIAGFALGTFLVTFWILFFRAASILGKRIIKIGQTIVSPIYQKEKMLK